MDLEHLSDRLTSQVDDLRDRAADAVGSRDTAGLREVGRLRRRLDELDEGIAGRLDALADAQAERLDALATPEVRTTWVRRLFWLGVGAAAGATTAFLADPDRGRARRSQLGDQLAATGRDLRDQVATSAEMTANQVRGSVIETAKRALPEDVPGDPYVLRQRIRSDVFGARHDVDDVVIRVDAPGEVALKGTVASSETERELVTAVAQVEGVVEVRSELAIAED